MKKQRALQRAITITGSKSALARAINVRRQAVQQWLERGVPAERCASVEEATGGRVTRGELRPDIYA